MPPELYSHRENHVYPTRVGSEPNSLVQTPPTDDLDLYEAKYMSGDELVVFRSKVRASWQVHALAGATALFCLVWSGLHAHWVGGLVSVAVILFTWLFLGVMRVKVSTTAVDIHYGLLGPRIPIRSIESAESVQHSHRSFLRWGISPNLQGEWIYSIGGNQGRAVKIVWRNARGRRKVHLIESEDPEQLASAIRRARALAAPQQPAAIAQGDPDTER